MTNDIKDTQNSLTDFDMCLALAQKAINSQMAAAWKSWIARSEFSETDEMKDFAFVSIYDNDFNTSGLEVDFDPLTVSLYVPNGKLGQVQVTLHLKSGTVFSEKVSLTRSQSKEIDKAVEDMIAEAVKKGKISPEKSNEDSVFDKYKAEYKKQNPKKFREEYEIKNWSISFLTDLDKKPCDRNLLKKIDLKVDEAVGKCIEAAREADKLPDSVFSIEYLFMKFTEVDLLLSDNKDIQIPPDVPKAVADKAKSCLNTLLRGKGNGGEFMLGTVVRRSKTRSEGHPIPTFALTDFAFHVTTNKDVPESSTLSYLGMFNQPLPKDKDLDNARLKLGDYWIHPEMLDGSKGLIAGTMAISKNIFMDKYLIPKITESLKEHFDEPKNTEPLSWSYKLNQKTLTDKKENKRTEDVVVREYKIAREGEINISLEKGTSKLKIFGFAKSSIQYVSYFQLLDVTNIIGPKLIFMGLNAAKNLIEGKDWKFDASLGIEGQQDFSLYINLSGTGGIPDFKVKTELEPKTTSEWFKPFDSKKDVQGTATWSDDTWFGDHIATQIFELFGINGGKTPNSLVKELNREVTDNLNNIIQKDIQNIEINMKNQAFIPPGGGEFTFQNLRFSDAGDLLFDVIYQAP